MTTITTTATWNHALHEALTGPTRWPTPGAMTLDLDPRHRQSPALDLIDDELVHLVEPGGVDRQMVFMPPQEGKSQKVSRRFPTWLLYRNPALRVIIVSYDDVRAVRWGRDIKRDLERHPELGDRIRLRPDSRAAGRWETDAGGGIYCAGIGSGITGEPGNVIIIDDPVKGPAEASSIAYRDAAWETWEGSIEPRLGGVAKVVLVMTRWHHDDLAGRLLERERGLWQVLSIPAIAEAGDPLGRPVGAELQSVMNRPIGHFRALRARRSPYVFEALYQQHPTAAEGVLFKRTDATFWQAGAGVDRFVLPGQTAEVDLRDCQRFVTIDLAASTRTSADFTVAAAWALTPGGQLLLLDLVRDRVPPTEHWDMVAPLRARWLSPGDVVHVESRMFGTTFVYEAGRAGIPLVELEADADKVTRAIPAAERWHRHTLLLPPERTWVGDFLDELAEFPQAAHDDQVDVTAYAAKVAATTYVPAGYAPQPARGGERFDPMTVDY